jgi:NitT/TauT family transport system substrate-binding protein
MRSIVRLPTNCSMFNNLGKILWVLVIMLLFTSMLTCTGKESTHRIRMGYMQVSTGLPLFVALERGMFVRERLDVEPIMFESVNQAMDAMLTGRIDGIQGVGFTTFMAVEQNAPGQFRLFWTCADTKEKYTSALLKRKGLPYVSIESVKGKKIGTYTGTTQVMNLKVILRNLGLDPDRDVQIVQVGRQLELQAFAAGQFEFLFTIEPDVTIAIEKGIGERFVDNPRVKYISDPFVAGGAVISARFIRERPKDLEKLVRVANSAIDYIRTNENQSKEYLSKYTPLDRQTALSSGLYEFWKLGEENRNAMQLLADLYLREGELRKHIDTASMLLPSRLDR